MGQSECHQLFCLGPEQLPTCEVVGNFVSIGSISSFLAVSVVEVWYSRFCPWATLLDFTIAGLLEFIALSPCYASPF